MLGEHGFAAVAVVVVLVSVGGGLATPVIVDSIDVDPDSPFYGLERIGEGIKETVVGGQSLDIALAEERTVELELMVKRAKIARYAWLADDVVERLEKAGEKVAENASLFRAIEAIQTRIEKLENLMEKENLPERARLAISLAVCRGSMVVGTLSEVQAKLETKERIRERIREVREEFRELRKEAEENLRLGMPAEPLIHKVNVVTARKLMTKIQKVVIGDPENSENLAEIVQKRLEDALANCPDNQAVQEVLEELREYWEKLENIRENLPEITPWLPVISRRIIVIIIIIEPKPIVIQPVPPVEPLPPVDWLENIRETIREVRREIKEIKKEIRERIRQGENIQEICENIDMSTVEILVQNLKAQIENIKDNIPVDIAAEKIHRMIKRADRLEKLERIEEILKKEILPLEENARVVGKPTEDFLEWAKSSLHGLREIRENIQAGELQPQDIRHVVPHVIRPPRWRR